MARIKFAKFCASGNDFIVIDNRSHILSQTQSEFAKDVCRRKFSIGADGLLLLDKFNGRLCMRIFNPDGSEAEMCGNGARAFARFIYEIGLKDKEMSFWTRAGEIRARIRGDNVRVGMPPPGEIELNIPLRAKGHTYTGHFINTGVPHLVVMVKSLKDFPVKEIGKEFRFHKRFMPRGTNVDFISFRRGCVLLRTYERGVEDETFACGTGAVASGIMSFLLGRIKRIPVKVMTKAGETLKVYFKKIKEVSGEAKFQDVELEGTVRLIYEGRLNL